MRTNGAAATAPYHSETMKEINSEWRSQNTAPKDRKILAFFEDFGWYPAAWSEDDQAWKVAKCKGRPGVKVEEPEWHEVTFRDDELCWWREWPSNTAPTREREADESADGKPDGQEENS